MSWEAYIEQATDGWPMNAREYASNLADWFASDPFGDWPRGYTAHHILAGKCRVTQVVEARHIIMYLIRQRSDMTLQSIAALVNRHHTTAVYASGRCRNCDKFEPLLAKKLRAAEAKTSTWSAAF